MLNEEIHYECEGTPLKGYLAWPDEPIAQKRPAVIVAHAWQGLDEFAKEKARALSNLGYIGFAADLYGHGKHVSKEDAPTLMLPLFLDRTLLQKRIKAAYTTLQKHPLVDSRSIGAIGFCFGGLTVIELLRSGVPIRGAVSFHGLLGDTMGAHKATRAPDQLIQGALLILHGSQDPLVSPADISTLQKELTDKGVDWQMNIYGHTAHAFTNPQAHDHESGLIFNSKVAIRAWHAMELFFEELFFREVT